MNRRQFIRNISAASLLIGAGAIPAEVLAAARWEKVTILHTNDVHSRIDPFPNDGGRHANLGGVARRASIIKSIREKEENVLLLDCGDIFQGTPYFNVFKGELEFKLMNEMGYDAATIGNHDFDAGIETLATHTKNANFKMLNCNYELKNTPLQGLCKPYQIFQKGNIKIGVFGVGIELDGLVPPALFGETQYLDPIKEAQKTATILKKDENCHLVICLSHLGFAYEGEKVSDMRLAATSRNIDLILGGHTHTFMERPYVMQNKDGQEVLINQVGWAGIKLGRLDFYFKKNKKQVTSDTQIVR